ncbi:MAG: dehydrogenase, short-chain alcohol dehydrogenase like, partial [Actinomycetia bacterium]|nr:dehydrogenase, short-chain alcohol dehydrogenase like [Actinomycetes bacterium]
TDVLHGVVPCAGLGPHVLDLAAIVAVNYFGAVAMLEGLHDLLVASGSGAAVAIGSNSATTDPTVDDAIVHACLRDDEVVARELASASRGHSVYASSKLALMRHVRRSVGHWGQVGVRLNAIAPGAFHSPLMDAVRADRELGRLVEAVPVPLAPSYADVDQIAAPIEFLLSADASWVHGACFFVDGGTDALVNPQLP